MENSVEPDRTQITTIMLRKRIAFWIIKDTYTHSEYVILITFTLQQWLHESASILCYAYIDCLV